MNAELSTTYADWKKVYDDHKWARDEANVKEILVGWCEEDQRIHVCFEVESMEVMEKFTQKHAEVIASSGHKQETTVVKILSDSQHVTLNIPSNLGAGEYGELNVDTQNHLPD